MSRNKMRRFIRVDNVAAAAVAVLSFASLFKAGRRIFLHSADI